MACISSYRRHPGYVTARQLCLIRTRQFSSEPAPAWVFQSLMNGWIPIRLSPFSCQTGYPVLTQTRAPFFKLYAGISLSLNLRFSILGRHRLCSSPSVGESYILHMFRFTTNPKVLVQKGELLPEPLPFSICQQCFLSHGNFLRNHSNINKQLLLRLLGPGLEWCCEVMTDMKHGHCNFGIKSMSGFLHQ